MSFGWSAGDIVAAIDTLIKIGKALRDSGGSASEFQSSVNCVTGVAEIMNGVKSLLDRNPGLVLGDGLREQAENLKSGSGRFYQED